MKHARFALLFTVFIVFFFGCDLSDNIKHPTKNCDNKTIDPKEIGSKIKVVDSQSPLMKASGEGNLENVKQLIKAGEDVNAMDYWEFLRGGTCVLGYALAGGSTPVIKELIQACANPNGLINHGVSIGKIGDVGGAFDNVRIVPLLTYAISRNMNLDLIKMLIEAGADVNAPSAIYDTTTPLIVAAAVGLDQVVDLLLKSGANKDHRNDKGKTALDYARQFNHQKVVNLLNRS